MAIAVEGEGGTTGGLIDLEPTISAGGPGSGSEAGSAEVDLVVGSPPSMTSETHNLRRIRLGQAALLLAIIYLGLFSWNALTRGVSLWVMGPLVIPRQLLRGVIATVIAGIVRSRLPLTAGAVRVCEAVLFGCMTLLLCLSQYSLNLGFIRDGDILGIVAASKNGLIQIVILMVIYGMFIPNKTRDAATVILSMGLALLATFALLMTHPAVAPLVATINRSEPIGVDLAFIAIGALLGIYGAHVLNGLRTELHDARKFGQYQLGRKLGAGGMGEVYLAEHQMLKRPCALKLIRPDAVTNPIALARFEREVRSAARLSHPNTIEIFDYGHTSDGTFYFVMEYLPGMSLEDLVNQFGPLPPARLVYLMRQACAGLAEAHSQGLVHRDLKPGNVFVALRGGESDVTKILDFGLVKLTHDPAAPQLTGDQVVSGTPHYMAPEQATGSADLDHRGDIYSLGAVAYFALTGRPPFVGDNAMNIMIAHVRDAIVPPSTHRGDLPKDLEQVVLKCLEKRPEDRYQDVKELSKALAGCESAHHWDDERASQWWVAAAQAVQGQTQAMQ